MLGSRVATGLVLIALFGGMLYLDSLWPPVYPFWLLAVVAAVLTSTRELVNLMQLTAARPSPGTVLGGCLAIVAANWLPHLMMSSAGARLSEAMSVLESCSPLDALVWPLWVFVAVVMVSFIGAGLQFQRPGGTVAVIAGTVLAVAYIGLLGSFLIQHRWLLEPAQSWLPLVLLVATCKGSDIGAYTLGRLAGRHKLWPQLSPNKTIEGAAGGLAFAILASILTLVLARAFTGVERMSLLEASGYGLGVGLVAQLGDLMESLIKRDCAAKDASDALPGFGGVLDVIDSILFAGPVSYAYWLLYGA
jgi:phosphatidate cytidylyltransferase